MTDQLKVSQSLAQVEYAEPSKLKVYQALAQVEYEPLPAGSYRYSPTGIDIATAVAGAVSAHYVYAGDVTASLDSESAYYYQGVQESIFFGDIGLEITPAAAGVLFEPAVTGDIPIVITPESTYWMPDRFYTGDIAVEVIPEGTCRQPITGWDMYTGWGMTDIAFLSGAPPYWVIEGALTFTLNNESNPEVYAEYLKPAAGGVQWGGSSSVAFETPEATSPSDYPYVTSGGIMVAGGGNVQFIDPTDYAHETDGGVLFGGATLVTEATPVSADLDHLALGGVVFASDNAIRFTVPADYAYSHATTGGIVFGEVRDPLVVFLAPAEVADYHVTVACTAAMEFGGAATVAYAAPASADYAHECRRGLVLFGGAAMAAWVAPPVFSHEAVGLVIYGGQGLAEADLYLTYALTGYTFEPSVYSGFDFNSYAQAGSRVYAAKDDGVYLLGGDDDHGQAIHPGVKIGPSNFGSHHRKRLRAIHLDAQGAPEVRVSDGGHDGYFQEDRGRFIVSRDIEGSELTVDIGGFETLSHVEFSVIPLRQR